MMPSAPLLADDADAAVLGVERSLCGRRWLLRPADDCLTRVLAQTLDVPPLVARMLAARGVGAEAAADFCAPTLRRLLPDPRLLRDMPQAAERVAAAVRGEQASVLSTLKHFPGHGASPDDSHVSIPRSDLTIEQWRATHAVPFQAGIDAGAPLVMMGHLQFDRISPLPASLSPTWVTILRQQLGFDGVIVTDDLLMLQRSGVDAYSDPVQNAIRALAAGNDLLLYVLPGDPATVGIDLSAMIGALAAAVREGRIDESRLDASLERVLALRRAASGESGPYIDCGPKCRGEASRPLVGRDGESSDG